MNFLATIFNFALFFASFLVITVNGIVSQGAYILFSLLLLTVPVLNLIMIYPDTKKQNWFSFTLKRRKNEFQDIATEHSALGYFLITLVITLNFVMLGLTVWAFIHQYPQSLHLRAAMFFVLVFVTPILSLLAIFRNRLILGHFSVS